MPTESPVWEKYVEWEKPVPKAERQSEAFEQDASDGERDAGLRRLRDSASSAGLKGSFEYGALCPCLSVAPTQRARASAAG